MTRSRNIRRWCLLACAVLVVASAVVTVAFYSSRNDVVTSITYCGTYGDVEARAARTGCDPGFYPPGVTDPFIAKAMHDKDVKAEITMGFGAAILVAGLVLAAFDLAERYTRCPACRKRVSARASMCPYCRTAFGHRKAPNPSAPEGAPESGAGVQ